MADEIVPFGKYKGQPLALLAHDQAYCEWLLGQHWFVQRYANIHTLIVNHFGEPAETPDHNRLQLRFLDLDFLSRCSHAILAVVEPATVTEKTIFLPFALPRFEVMGADVVWRLPERGQWEVIRAEQTIRTALGRAYDKDISDLQARRGNHIETVIQHEQGRWEEINARFTDVRRQCAWQARGAHSLWGNNNPCSIGRIVVYGYASTISVENACPNCRRWGEERNKRFMALHDARERAWQDAATQYEAHVNVLRPFFSSASQSETLAFVEQWEGYSRPFSVECKPALGDDFPAVLRFVTSLKQDQTPYRAVVIEQYTGAGGTLEQVRVFFGQSGIVLLTVPEIEATSPLRTAALDDLYRKPLDDAMWTRPSWSD